MHALLSAELCPNDLLGQDEHKLYVHVLSEGESKENLNQAALGYS